MGLGPTPSIISQLLASSQPSSAASSPKASPRSPNKDRQTSEQPRQMAHSPAITRHRRAVSTMDDMRNMEADGLLPPLTSPFSPPAFNPYDIVLGSNEAIAGLDSPAPRTPVPPSGAPQRQAASQTRDQAFSWLEDKIGDLKVSKEAKCNQPPDVFQFPTVETRPQYQQPAAVAVSSYQQPGALSKQEGTSCLQQTETAQLDVNRQHQEVQQQMQQQQQRMQQQQMQQEQQQQVQQEQQRKQMQ